MIVAIFLRRRSVSGKLLMFFQIESLIRVFKILRRSANRKDLIRFQSETSVSKFLWRGVNGKHSMRF